MFITVDMKHYPNGYKQRFRYEPTDTASVSKKKLIELVQRGAITKKDIAIMKFFYKFSIATPELVERALGINKEEFRERADKLVVNRILNKFTLSNDEMDTRVPKNAQEFYSCDMGTPMLLECFEPGDDFGNWRITDHAVCDSSRIERYLMVIEFYLALKEACKARLLMFETKPRLSAGRVRVKPNAVFCVEYEGVKRFFVLEAVREDDLFTMDGNRFTAKLSALESLLSSDAWRAYYTAEDKPVLLLMGDSDDCMKQIGAMAAQTKLDAVRLTTRTRVDNGFGATKVFAKYDLEKNKISNVKVSVLAPEK